MHRLVLKKEQQQDEAWTLLSSNAPNTTTPLQPPVCHDPHKDAFDVIMGAVRSAGPRGVMALVATLMESSVGNEDHRSLLNNIQEDSAYTSIKKAWLKSVLSK